jgi:uncharacterized phosphosugar-binding protein
MTTGLAQTYLVEIRRLLDNVQQTQMENILRASDVVAQAIAGGHSIWVFGAGHSHMLAEELFVRAGGLAGVQAIFEPSVMLHEDVWRASALERQEGLAAQMLSKYELKKGDVLIVASNSGRNALPIETAMIAKDRGLTVIALTSLAHSRSVASRHSSGKRLLDVADIVLDNGCPAGDAILEVKGSDAKACGTSTILGATVLNTVMAGAIDRLLEMGITPPIFISANLDGTDDRNRGLVKRD